MNAKNQLLGLSVFALLCSTILSKCAEGCLKCKGHNICEICDSSSLYVLSNGECVKQTMDFCLLTFSLKSCLMCYPGYYLERSGKCVKNPEGVNQIANCKVYDSYTRCKTCYQYYYLADAGQTCREIEGDVIENCVVYDSSSVCQVCGDYILSSQKNRCDPPKYSDKKCMFYSDKTTCRKCKDGFYFDKNFYIRNIASLYEYLTLTFKNYYYHQYSIVNVPTCEKKTLIENCEEPLGNHKCQKCADGFYINSTFDACIANPPESVFFRTDNITNCYLHNKTTVVRNNVEVLNIECILCYENYYKTVNNRKCMPHTSRVNNCKVMSQSIDEECILCDTGFYRKDDEVSGEKCQARVDTNDLCQTYHLLSEACETCVDATYIKHYGDKFCSPPIPDCKVYETSGVVLSCKQCTFGFYFDTNSAQCLKNNDIFDPYCAYYDANKLCQECYFGFYYDTSKSPATCEPNTPEYVDLARCSAFHALNKNECIGCASSSAIVQLQYTCKAFRNTNYKGSNVFDYISYCEKYELTSTGAFRCMEAKAEVQNDDETLKKVYVLITDEERAFDKTADRVAYCDLHEQNYKTSNDPILCNTCYKKREISTDFDYSNLKDTANCSDTETDSGYCVKFFSSLNTCREYTYYNIDSTACPDFDRAKGDYTLTDDDEVRAKACPWYGQTSYTTNNCSVEGDVKSYQCYSRDGSDNCNIYHFFQDEMGARFTENIEFEIVISPDKASCLQYNTFKLENNSNCVQSSTDGTYCLLCAKSFYSIPTRTFTYELDSIESYISKINVTGFVEGCVKYNDITKLCTRCAFGKYLSRNECVTCSSNNMAIDSTGLVCLQFVDTNFPDTCEQISVLNTNTYCIKCKEGYVGKINWDTNVVLSKSFYPIIGGVQTMIEMTAHASSFTSCDDSNDLFYYQESYKDTINNCLFYNVYNGVSYCLGCKFGFVGEIYETPNNFLTIQNCTVDDTRCDTSVTYPLEDPYISSLVTCHKCPEAGKIPSFLFFYNTAIGVSNIEFLYKHPNGRTMRCADTDVLNCLIQFESKDETVQVKWGFTSNPNNNRKVCVYCEPGYTPTYENISDNYFPYRKITACTAIDHCESSLIPNKCEQCQTSGVTSDLNTKALRTSNGVTTCEENEYIKIDPFCSETSSNSAAGVCDTCKDGYVYLNQKCVALNVTSCKYFRADVCVESVKELDEMKSIIWREYNSDYVVETINCVEVPDPITNCEYYASETTCHQCLDGFFLGNNGKSCYERNIGECKEYDDVTMTCSLCNDGFDKANDGTCTVAAAGNARGCTQYSDGFCSSCSTEGFLPVKIQSNQTSICINATIHPFCAEVDADLLKNEKILSCKTCKLLSDYETVAAADDFELSNYDFFTTATSTYADDKGLLKVSQLYSFYNDMRNYYINQNSNSNLRFALFKYDYNICQEYIPIDNCLKYDDSSFEQTFDCIECTAAYYLNNNSCHLRTTEAFCIEYEISSNTCKRYIDTWDYSITLSTFDEFVIANNPPAKSSQVNVDEGIEGCIAYEDQNTCRHCNRTTYLYDNLCLTVHTIVPQCETYSRDGFCTECQDGLLLFQNKCLPMYSQNCYGFLSNTSCRSCPMTHPYLSGGSCVKNPAMDFCDDYSKIDSCKHCEDAFSRTQAGTCILKTEYIKNCKKHMDGPFCLECKDNYVLINNECILNPNYDRNCLEFKATSECNVCQFNHYFKVDQCFPCKTDPFECLFCNPDNPSECLLCKSGFFMNNEFQCIAIPNFTQPLIRLYQESMVTGTAILIVWGLSTLGLLVGF